MIIGRGAVGMYILKCGTHVRKCIILQEWKVLGSCKSKEYDDLKRVRGRRDITINSLMY